MQDMCVCDGTSARAGMAPGHDAERVERSTQQATRHVEVAAGTQTRYKAARHGHVQHSRLSRCHYIFVRLVGPQMVTESFGDWRWKEKQTLQYF